MGFVVTQPAAKPTGGSGGFKVVVPAAQAHKPGLWDDIAQSFNGGMLREALTLADTVANPLSSLPIKGFDTPQSVAGSIIKPSNVVRVAQAANNALMHRPQVAPQDYKSQTAAGRVSSYLGGMVPNALMGPEGVGRRIVSVLVPGLIAGGSAEGARAMGGNDLAQSIAGAFGGALGGFGLSGVRAKPAGAAPAADGAVDALAARAKADAPAMRAKAQQMRAAGVDPTLSDVVGERGRRVLRAVGVKSPDAGEVLQGHAKTVSATTKPAVMARTRALAGGDGRTADQVAADLTAARDSAAKENYKGPYGEAVQVPDSVRDMLRDSSGRSIIARARADAIENQDWAGQTELDKLTQVTDGPLPRVSAATMDRLVIAARERAATFARAGRNYRARGAGQRRNELDATLNDISAIQPARADYRAKSQGIDIINKPGARKDVFSTDPKDYAAWHASLPPEAQKANAIAIRQEVLDTLGGQRSSTLGSIDELASSQYARDNLRVALGGEADPYIAHLNARLDQARNANFVSPNAGSRTEVLKQDIPGAAAVLEGGQVVGHALHGNWPAVATKLVAMLQARGISDVHAQRIAEMAKDPTKVDAVISYLEQAQGAKTARDFKALLPAANAAALGARSTDRRP